MEVQEDNKNNLRIPSITIEPPYTPSSCFQDDPYPTKQSAGREKDRGKIERKRKVDR
jgi:hypothetical protein